MRLARALAAIALLATLVLLSSDGVLSQDKKDSGKIRGQLPSGWTKLNLTAVQKQEVYTLNRDYKVKIDKLKAEIKSLEEELARKRVAVLTDEQRKKLIELVGGVPGESPKDKGKTKEPGKN